MDRLSQARFELVAVDRHPTAMDRPIVATSFQSHIDPIVFLVLKRAVALDRGQAGPEGANRVRYFDQFPALPQRPAATILLGSVEVGPKNALTDNAKVFAALAGPQVQLAVLHVRGGRGGLFLPMDDGNASAEFCFAPLALVATAQVGNTAESWRFGW